MEVNLETLLKKNQIMSYNSDCIRKKSNWSKSGAIYKFDSDTFDPEMLLNDMSERSPKLDALLSNITKLDEADMQRDGERYKHFIFCDVKSGTQGARMLASAFIASGFHLGYNAQKKGEAKPSSPNDKVKQKSTFKKVREDTPRPSSDLPPNVEFPEFKPMEGVFEDEEEEEDSEEEGGDEDIQTNKTVGGADSPKSPSTKKKGSKSRFQKLEMYDTAHLKRTQGKNFYLLSSVNVYDQPINVKLKKQMLSNFNQRPSNIHGKEVRFIIMDSGFKEGIDLFDIKYIHIFEPSVNTADQKQVIGRGTRTCGQKGLTFHPTQGWPLHVFVYDMSIPETIQPGFMDSESTFDLYLKSMNVDIRLARFAADTEETSIYGSVDYELNREVHTFNIPDVQDGGAPKRSRPKLIVDDLPPIVVDPTGSSMQIRLPSGQTISGMESKPMGFKLTREYVQKFFSDCKWTDVKMENLCEDIKKGGSVQIEYTPTQRFIKQYFTPQCPVKGMLLWHSTGTGKTCSAIAAATSNFDPQGYTILWVTRTTLKNDIWKNMFDQICNEQIRTMVADGITLPEDHAKRMRMLSKAWRIRPISYKQFSNLVSKENNYYKQLVSINGESDPLRKTLLIIDEAHKLYGGGDLSSLERPDMNALHGALMNSYAVSGRESVRVLLMTATPITENPMEMIKLVNLCKPMDDQIPAQFPVFSTEYLNEEGGFTPDGRRNYLDKIAGHISYLNRERDARQFAQPRLKKIMVPLVKNVQEISMMDKRFVRSTMDKDVQEIKGRIETENAKIESDMKDLDATRFYALRDICDEYDGVVKKGCLKIANSKIRALVKEARAQTKDIKQTVKSIREEMKNKRLYRREALKEMSERLKESPEELAKFQKGMYYTLKYECGKNAVATPQFDELSQMHPRVAQLRKELDGYDAHIKELDDGLTLFADAHKTKMKDFRKILRSYYLSDLERSVVKSTIKDAQKQFRKTRKDRLKLVASDKKDIGRTQKDVRKQLRKTMRSLKNDVKLVAKEQKSQDKEINRAEKQLRKTLRKQGELREEFQDGVMKNLMNKYTLEVNDDLATQIEMLKQMAEEKAAKKKERADEKAAKKKEKADANVTRKLEKERAKIARKQEKEHAKTVKKHEKDTAKAVRKEQKDTEKRDRSEKKNNERIAKKSIRLTKKIRISKTAKI